MKLKALSTLIASSMLYSQSFAVPPEKTAEEPQPFFNKTESGYDLVFNDQNYRLIETELNGEKIQFRAFERIVYVNNPIEPDYQTINLYVPEAYYNNGEINGYQADTAPIFLPNSVGAICRQKRQVMIKKDVTVHQVRFWWRYLKAMWWQVWEQEDARYKKRENTPAKHLLPL
ncbi:TPA: hypothetical protein PWX02_001880, partial [Mannheimia haemolytica]|nr:hypothetical protein [Mannheimia haemolytica]